MSTVDIVVPDRDAVVEIVTAPTSANVDIATTGPPGPSGDPAGYVFPPSFYGLAAYTLPADTYLTSSPLPAGRIQAVAFRLAAPATLTAAVFVMSTVGAGLTAGQNLIGVYSMADGSRLAQTADLSAAWVGPIGAVTEAPFTAPVQLPAGDYWAALLANGTTPPGIYRPSSGAMCNAGRTAANFRCGQTIAGMTALPTTMPTLSAATTMWWLGIK